MPDYMKEALKEAKKAFRKDEVPIGCVIVKGDEIIARAHNSKVGDNNSLAHAEMKALRSAQRRLGTKYLSECKMYVTLEPCAMCAGAMVNARLGELMFALEEPKTGCCGSTCNLIDGKFNHTVRSGTGEGREESLSLMQEFFKLKRCNK